MSNQITSAASNIYSPLTKEEIELFSSITGSNKLSNIGNIAGVTEIINNVFSELSKTIDSMKQDNQIQSRALIDAVTELTTTIKEQNETNRKQIAAIDRKKELVEKSNLIFCSNTKYATRQSLRKVMEGDIERMHIDTGKSVNAICKDIYKGMKNKFGHDVNKLHDEYELQKPGASVMDMCIASDILRSCMYAQIESMKANPYSKKIVVPKKTNAVKKDKYTFVQANRCPSEIYDLVALLSKNGKWSAWSSKKTLCALGKKIDINKIVNNFTKKNGISKCNPWFAISKDNDAMTELRNMIFDAERF